MPLRTIEPRVIFGNLCRDFEGAWDGIAKSPSVNIGRGNFLFGFLATLLLEWACRVCHQDSSGSSLKRLASALHQIEPLYFTELPRRCRVRTPRKNAFRLPLVDGKRPPPLLWALFDLIRNGQAHQYQQIPARLDDDAYLWISIRGAEAGRTLAAAAAQRPSDHLAFCEYRDGNVGIRVWADTCFLDIRAAIEASGLLDSELTHKYFTRSYESSRSDVIAALEAAKHSRFFE